MADLVSASTRIGFYPQLRIRGEYESGREVELVERNSAGRIIQLELPSHQLELQ